MSQVRKCFSLVDSESAGLQPTVVPSFSVLLVDDAHFFCELFADLLSPLNLNLQLAANTSEALECLHKANHHLVMLDRNLPDKHGLDLIANIRADERLSQTRILATSVVHRREDDAVEAIRSEADAFINKPFRPDESRGKVKNLLPA